MAGLVPYYKIGRAVRFRKADLDAALGRMRMPIQEKQTARALLDSGS
jgi:hypothetical protein